MLCYQNTCIMLYRLGECHDHRERATSADRVERQTATRAPLLDKYSRVGIEARMRVSSVMVFPSRGTLTSQRMRIFLPLSSSSLRSEMDFLASRLVEMLAERTPKAIFIQTFYQVQQSMSINYIRDRDREKNTAIHGIAQQSQASREQKNLGYFLQLQSTTVRYGTYTESEQRQTHQRRRGRGWQQQILSLFILFYYSLFYSIKYIILSLNCVFTSFHLMSHAERTRSEHDRRLT